MHKKLARIDRTSLGYEDHGIFTSMLHVSYEGSSGQGIGGYALDGKPEGDHERPGTSEGMQFIINTIKACGVESWEKLPGKMIYVLTEDESWHAKVVGIQAVSFKGDSEPFLFRSLWPTSV